MKAITIEVVSPPRCGSTLTYHFLNQYIEGKNNNFFSFQNINKSHPPFEPNQLKLHSFDYETFYVFCIRHPYSTLASLFIYDMGDNYDVEASLNERYVFNKVNEIVRDYKWCYDFIKQNSLNVTTFRYEHFVNNYRYFFDYFSRTFGLEFTDENIDEFYERYNSDNLYDKLRKTVRGSDPYYHSFAPHHISFSRGNNEDNIAFIPFRFRSRIQRELKEVYEMFNYNPVSLAGIPFHKEYHANCRSD